VKADRSSRYIPDTFSYQQMEPALHPFGARANALSENTNWTGDTVYAEEWGCDETQYWEERQTKAKSKNNLLLIPTAPPSIATAASEPPVQRGPVIVDFAPANVGDVDLLGRIMARQKEPKPLTTKVENKWRKVKVGMEHVHKRRLWSNLHRQFVGEVAKAKDLGTLEGWKERSEIEWWADTEADSIEDQEVVLMEYPVREWIRELIRRRVEVVHGIVLRRDGKSENESEKDDDANKGKEYVEDRSGLAKDERKAYDEFGEWEIEEDLYGITTQLSALMDDDDYKIKQEENSTTPTPRAEKETLAEEDALRGVEQIEFNLDEDEGNSVEGSELKSNFSEGSDLQDGRPVTNLLIYDNNFEEIDGEFFEMMGR
jgi:hypothetical protein